MNCFSLLHVVKKNAASASERLYQTVYKIRGSLTPVVLFYTLVYIYIYIYIYVFFWGVGFFYIRMTAYYFMLTDSWFFVFQGWKFLCYDDNVLKNRGFEAHRLPSFRVGLLHVKCCGDSIINFVQLC